MLPNPATAMRRQALVRKVADAVLAAHKERLDVDQLVAEALHTAHADPRWAGRPASTSRAVDVLLGG